MDQFSRAAEYERLARKLERFADELRDLRDRPSRLSEDEHLRLISDGVHRAHVAISDFARGAAFDAAQPITAAGAAQQAEGHGWASTTNT